MLSGGRDFIEVDIFIFTLNVNSQLFLYFAFYWQRFNNFTYAMQRTKKIQKRKGGKCVSVS